MPGGGLRFLLVLLLVLILTLAGCATASYEAPDGTKVNYTRLFTTMDTIAAEASPTTGAKVKAAGQKNLDPAALQALFDAILRR